MGIAAVCRERSDDNKVTFWCMDTLPVATGNIRRIFEQHKELWRSGQGKMEWRRIKVPGQGKGANDCAPLTCLNVETFVESRQVMWDNVNRNPNDTVEFTSHADSKHLGQFARKRLCGTAEHAKLPTRKNHKRKMVRMELSQEKNNEGAGQVEKEESKAARESKKRTRRGSKKKKKMTENAFKELSNVRSEELSR